MKLLRQVERLEAAAAVRAVEPAAVSLVWSSDEVVVDLAQLRPGEYVATDVTIEERLEGVSIWRTRERLTCDVRDLGNVYDVDGELVGRIVAIDGPMVEWRPI